eukprot:Gb_23930 [translate_table: standard]
MEDFYDAKMSKINDQMVGLFGVFDGHGGSRAAEYLKQHLFENLIKHPQFATDTKLALTETYQQTDSEFLKAESSIYRDDGSTASTAVLVGDRLYVANVGDSRAVILKAGEDVCLVIDPLSRRITRPLSTSAVEINEPVGIKPKSLGSSMVAYYQLEKVVYHLKPLRMVVFDGKCKSLSLPVQIWKTLFYDSSDLEPFATSTHFTTSLRCVLNQHTVASTGITVVK